MKSSDDQNKSIGRKLSLVYIRIDNVSKLDLQMRPKVNVLLGNELQPR